MAVEEHEGTLTGGEITVVTLGGRADRVSVTVPADGYDVWVRADGGDPAVGQVTSHRVGRGDTDDVNAGNADPTVVKFLAVQSTPYSMSAEVTGAAQDGTDIAAAIADEAIARAAAIADEAIARDGAIAAAIAAAIADEATARDAAIAAATAVPSRFIFGVPATAPADGALAANQISFWSNDGSNLLAFKMKNSAGVVKTGIVALT